MNHSNIPQHIGIILDGNRRFAKRLMLEPWRGHEHGAGKVGEILKVAKELGIKELTFYALSVENLNRDKKELDFLLNIFRKEFKNLSNEEVHKNKIKIRFIGRLDLLPSDLAEQCLKLQEETAKYKDYIVNFAVAYGGRQEIVDAVKKILSGLSAKKISSEDIDEELISKNLYMSDNPDMIIRTGGEKRTSNFLPWQSAYSELIFLDKMWPEFTVDDLKACIKEYAARERRFGK
ncbi:MAG: polyprenyl diphosphate synthase [archaeon]